MHIYRVFILVLLFDSVLFNWKHFSSCILYGHTEGRREPLSAIPNDKFHLEIQFICFTTTANFSFVHSNFSFNSAFRSTGILCLGILGGWS